MVSCLRGCWGAPDDNVTRVIICIRVTSERVISEHSTAQNSTAYRGYRTYDTQIVQHSSTAQQHSTEHSIAPVSEIV